MSNITLDELVEAEQGNVVPAGEVESFETIERQPSRVGEIFQKLITAETGAGSIDTYIDHPMNFNRSKGLAQLIRGMTGIIGNLDLAVIDIVFGAFRFSKEKGGVPVDSSKGDGVLIR